MKNKLIDLLAATAGTALVLAHSYAGAQSANTPELNDMQLYEYYNYKIGTDQDCIQYPTNTVGRFVKTVIASKSPKDIYNRQAAIDIGYLMIDKVKENSPPRCTVGSVFYIIHYKDRNKCTFFDEKGDINTACFYQNDMDYAYFALENPKNPRPSGHFNYSLKLGKTTQARLDQLAAEKRNAQAAAQQAATADRQRAQVQSRQAFKQNALRNIPAAYASAGTDMVNYFADQCHPVNGWPQNAACRDFIFGRAEQLPLNRADSANGVTGRIKVYGSVLFRAAPSEPWKLRCNNFVYTKFKSSQWMRGSVYSLTQCI